MSPTTQSVSTGQECHLHHLRLVVPDKFSDDTYTKVRQPLAQTAMKFRSPYGPASEADIITVGSKRFRCPKYCFIPTSLARRQAESMAPHPGHHEDRYRHPQSSLQQHRTFGNWPLNHRKIARLVMMPKRSSATSLWTSL